MRITGRCPPEDFALDKAIRDKKAPKFSHFIRRCEWSPNARASGHRRNRKENSPSIHSVSLQSSLFLRASRKRHGVSLTRPVSGIGNDKVEVSHGHAPRRTELITRLRARQMEAPEEASCAGSLGKSGRWEAAFAVIRLLRGHTRLIQEAGAINLVTSWIHL